MSSTPRITDEVNPGLDADSIRRDFVAKLLLELAKFPAVATPVDCYLSLAHVVRDRLLSHWVRSAQTFFEEGSRTVVYLSAEYLMGPQLANNLMALDIADEVRQALKEVGLELDDLIAQEEEPGLGNGGLGRLAACFMDSLATLEVPAIGYGIRYEFGIFDQRIRDGAQVEHADRWLRYGNPWEVPRYEVGFVIGFGGQTLHDHDEDGRLRVHWMPDRIVKGIPFDTPVLGYGTRNANFLRLWAATIDQDFDLDAFNQGDFQGAVLEKVRSENITKILYPNDANAAGKQLRLEQQYFFVSCSLQDMIRLFRQRDLPLSRFHEKFAIQLNDTHPALAVAELMRLFVDVHGFDWDEAWEVTRKCFGYTNHTLLPEALETWPLDLFATILPRHLEIIYEINARFLAEVAAAFPGDTQRLRRMSLIGEGDGRSVRMAHLAAVGSARVNGVAALHSRLLRETVMRDFAELWPERFTNITNGVTPRRFLALANPRLAALITDAIGEGWIRNLDRLAELEPMADDAAFRQAFRDVKLQNKRDLAAWLKPTWRLGFDPEAMLDVQVKRIHEYKRQHLAILHVLALLDRIDRGQEVVPRTFLFGGKAAPGYRAAKLMIRMIHAAGDAVAAHPVARNLLRVVFVPDFNVTSGSRIYPAADLSEQISTAGKEASGTGNMKLAMNGALTIGTLDGANVEIREAVGEDNFFLFGLTVDAIERRRAAGYDPRESLDAESERILDRLGRLQDGLYSPLVISLLETDEYMLLADFRSYVDTQAEVSDLWRRPDDWSRAAVLNVARMGRFSSDRAIAEYCRDVWKVVPVPVDRG